MDVTCSISGLRLRIAGFKGAALPANSGYFHPIFAADYNQLYSFYYRHCKNSLNPVDSYLLFLAFLNATDQVKWETPAACNPSDSRTIKLVQNNIQQLVSMTERTNAIHLPSFKQPSFIVAADNNLLQQVRNWIVAWEENLERFKKSVATSRRIAEQQYQLHRAEEALAVKLTEGTPLKELPVIVANWASQAADFPPDKAEQYKKVIRSCFNSSKMFNTPMTLIKEVQEYCYSSIEPGSIHFHTLAKILKEGADRHLDYLGGSTLALGYTLLESNASGTSQLAQAELKTQAELAAISSTAPAEKPAESDYSTKLAYLKAKLAYTVATRLNTSILPASILPGKENNALHMQKDMILSKMAFKTAPKNLLT